MATIGTECVRYRRENGKTKTRREIRSKPELGGGFTRVLGSRLPIARGGGGELGKRRGVEAEAAASHRFFVPRATAP